MLWVWLFSSTLGTVVELKQMSAKDRLERKKYMGVCRRGSELTARMMSRFPVTVTTYMDKNSPKRTGGGSSLCESQEEKVSNTCLVSAFHGFWGLPRRRKKSNTKFTPNRHSLE